MLAMYLRTGRIHHLSTFLTNCFVFPWLWSSSGDTWPGYLIRWLLLQPLVEIYHINIILTRFWHICHATTFIVGYISEIYFLTVLGILLHPTEEGHPRNQPMDDQIFSLSYLQINWFRCNCFWNCYIEMINESKRNYRGKWISNWGK